MTIAHPSPPPPSPPPRPVLDDPDGPPWRPQLKGLDAGLTRCHVCGAVCRLPASPRAAALPCPRCGHPVHGRHPDSLSRTTALLIAAAVLYIPANLLPVMHTKTILGAQDDTIMSGVLVLLDTGSWPLALVVFVASIVVPMLKLLALALLVATTARRSPWARLQRTRLYRLIDAVGRWSMLDIYVITVLVGLVQFRTLASVLPGPGAMAFAAVVVLTMLATHTFDTRLIWDASEPTQDD